MLTLLTALLVAQAPIDGGRPIPTFRAISTQVVNLDSAVTLFSGTRTKSMTVIAFDGTSVESMQFQDFRTPTLVVEDEACFPIWNWETKRMWCVIPAIANPSEAVVWGPHALPPGTPRSSEQRKALKAAFIAEGKVVSMKGAASLSPAKMKDWKEFLTSLHLKSNQEQAQE